MRYFSILVDGVPSADLRAKWWVIITRYDVNCMILDNQCFIFGYANDKTIDELIEEVKGFKLPIIMDERGPHDGEKNLLDTF